MQAKLTLLPDPAEDRPAIEVVTRTYGGGYVAFR
jgi:hypothetical protein